MIINGGTIFGRISKAPLFSTLSFLFPASSHSFYFYPFLNYLFSDLQKKNVYKPSSKNNHYTKKRFKFHKSFKSQLKIVSDSSQSGQQKQRKPNKNHFKFNTARTTTWSKDSGATIQVRFQQNPDKSNKLLPELGGIFRATGYSPIRDTRIREWGANDGL